MKIIGMYTVNFYHKKNKNKNFNIRWVNIVLINKNYIKTIYKIDKYLKLLIILHVNCDYFQIYIFTQVF